MSGLTPNHLDLEFYHPPWPIRARLMGQVPENAVAYQYGFILPNELFDYDFDKARAGALKIGSGIMTPPAVYNPACILTVPPSEQAAAKKKNLQDLADQLSTEYLNRYSQLMCGTKGKEAYKRRKHFRARLKADGADVSPPGIYARRHHLSDEDAEALETLQPYHDCYDAIQDELKTCA